MSAPTIFDVLEAVATRVRSLDLPMDVQVRKTSKWEQGLDPRPTLQVHPVAGVEGRSGEARGSAETVTPWATGLWSWVYSVGVTFYDANRNDQATTTEQLSIWRDMIADTFKAKDSLDGLLVFSGQGGLRNVRSSPSGFLGPADIAKGFDKFKVDVQVEVIKGD